MDPVRLQNATAEVLDASVRRSPLLAVGAGLVALAGASYAGVVDCGFVFDDNNYFDLNPHVRQGLTWAGARWALTAEVAGNWLPLTLLSHMLDVQLFGVDAAAHHLVNVLLHTLNTLLLFLVLRAVTGDLWRCALVAALFAAHPLHVESVAWIAERKDLLSSFFGLLALAAYRCHAGRPGPARYLALLLCYAASLACKPMLVTLPFLLLLLDFWPLNRGLRWQLVAEKLPLLAGTVAASAAALHFQRLAGAMPQGERFPPGVRIANAAAAYFEYLRKSVWPVDLGVLYPHPGSALPPWKLALGLLVLLCGLLLAFLARRRRPALAVGWLWFCGLLVPVIGVVQVGDQAFADRYVYLPVAGLFVGAAWSIPPSLPRGRRGKALTVGIAGVVVLLSALSARQVGHWKSNRTLYQRALAVSPANWMMHANLAADLLATGETAEALAHQREVARLRPELAEGRHNLALALAGTGSLEEAVAEFRECLRLDPHHARADRNLGRALLGLGRAAEALPHLARGARLQPGNAEARLQLGEAHLRLGHLEAAEAALRDAVRLDPGNNWLRQYWEFVRRRAAGGG